MRAFSCFPILSCGLKSKKKKASSILDADSNHSNEISGKATNAKVWPGDVTPPSSSRSPKRSLTTNLTVPVDHDEHDNASISISSSAKLLPIIATRGDDYDPKEESDKEGESPSFQSALKHVEDWVKSLDELGDMAEEEQHDACAPAAIEEEADPDRELNGLVVQSLDPLATNAHFSGIGLKSIPFLGAFSNLRSLSVSGNSIVKIHPGCLPRSLHFLDLSRNKISVIEGLRGLNRLRSLNLSYNRISRVGHGLGNCTSIRELYLSGNKISEVEGLHRLRKLFLLDLSNNRLTTAKSLVQLAANYSCLQVLNLLGNAVVLNLGDDQLKRLVGAIVPNLSYLNKQPIKAVPAREAVVGKFARTELLGGGNRYARKSKRSSGSKAKRVESLQAHSSRKSGARRLSKHF